MPEPLHCVLVDDEPSVRFVIERLLRRDGWEVTSFGDGPSALAWLAAPHVPVHCIITDIMLPQQTGPAWIAEALTRGLIAPTLPVCFASGYHDPTLLREATPRLTRWRMLQKPVRMTTLVDTVRELLADPSAG